VAGDTVWEISQRFNSSVNAIIQVNGLNNAGLINVGQTLVIPVKATYTPPPTFTPAPPGGGTGGGPVTPGVSSYTVKGGDTLYAISQRLNTTVATMAQINSIVSNLIYPARCSACRGCAAADPTTATAYRRDTVPRQVPISMSSSGKNLFRIACGIT
jgi:LysM repeat protein